MSYKINPPICGGRVMDRATLTRSWLCSCGREVYDEAVSEKALTEFDSVEFAHVQLQTVDDGARGQWREPWPSAEGAPKHVLSAPIVTAPPCHCTSPFDPGAFGFAEYHAIVGDHPNDAEIVERMESHLRFDESFGRIIIRGHRVGKAEQSAAWSRVLAAKVAASDAARTEAARRVVLGPIDDEDEA